MPDRTSIPPARALAGVDTIRSTSASTSPAGMTDWGDPLLYFPDSLSPSDPFEESMKHEAVPPTSGGTFKAPDLGWGRMMMDCYIPGSLSEAEFAERYVKQKTSMGVRSPSQPVDTAQSLIKRELQVTRSPALNLRPAPSSVEDTSVSAQASVSAEMGDALPRVGWDAAVVGFGFGVGAVFAGQAGAVVGGVAAYLWGRHRWALEE